MPFISGVELARQVRELRPRTQIAFLSGYDDFEYAQQAIAYNVIRYLLKPIGSGGLFPILDKLMRQLQRGEDTLLLTGLVNGQSVRTCEMLDVPCIVFVRGKEPQPDALEMAEEIGLPALRTPYTMYEACGRLYAAGLPPVKLG